MLPERYAWIGVEFEPEGDPRLLLDIALRLEEEGNQEAAATVYDRAYGLDPAAEDVRQGRHRVLSRLAVVEHGIRFGYIPGGVFLMGCDTGEPDERPWHPVWVSPYWMSETPISWATYCRLMGLEPPPFGDPNKIRHQYSIGTPPRTDSAAPWQYESKPLVAVAWQEAQGLASRLSTDRVHYSLPTEAQWEKSARGGLIGARHAWGNDGPMHERCDFDRFHEFSILSMKTFPPNGYGLYAMNGCVWEWTRDWYDRDYYRHSPEVDPEGPPEGQEKVLRGGSWADCAEVVTVTFRMSRGAISWRERGGPPPAPNIGFRLCRVISLQGGGLLGDRRPTSSRTTLWRQVSNLPMLRKLGNLLPQFVRRL